MFEDDSNKLPPSKICYTGQFLLVSGS